MKIEIPEDIMAAKIAGALLGDGYGGDAPLRSAVRQAVSDGMPELERLLAQEYRDLLASEAFRATIRAAIQGAVAQAAQEEAGKLAKRRARTAIEAGALFADGKP